MNIMNMIRKKNVYLLLCVVVVFIFLIYLSFTLFVQNKNSAVYTIETFKSDSAGWGYQILKNRKVIILQPYMPCVESEKSFPDERSARETGEFVLTKIENNIAPSITKEELEKIVKTYNR